MFFGYKKMMIKVVMMALCFSLMMPASAFGSNHSKQTYYVALGDSISVGFEPGMTTESRPYGFVDRVYEQALFHGRTELRNYGIGGLTSTGLKNFLQAVQNQSTTTAHELQPKLPDPRVDQFLQMLPQIKQDLEKATLMTITIGGNDLRDMIQIVMGDPATDIQKLANERLPIIQKNVAEILEMVHQLNPTAKVYLADQYQPIPALANKGLHDKLNNVSAQWSAQLEKIVQDAQAVNRDVHLVKVAESFKGRELSLTHIIKTDIHPNQDGYALIAKLFTEAIWGQYATVKHKEPVAIVISGQELNIQNKPVIINGHTYLPVREYVESLGARVAYDGKTRTTSVILNDQEVSFMIEASLTTEEAKQTSFKGDVLIYNSKTYVSLRAVTSGLGFDVHYSSKSKTIYINP